MPERQFKNTDRKKKKNTDSQRQIAKEAFDSRAFSA